MSSRPKKQSYRDRGPAPSVQQMMGKPSPSFTALGKTWQLGFNTQDAKGRLEALIAAHVWEKEYKTADAMTPEMADRHLARIQAKFDSGQYATLAAGWQQIIGTPDGVILFILSLMQEHHPDLTATEALAVFSDNPREVKRALTVIAPDFFRAVLRQLGATEAAVNEKQPELDRMIATLTEEEKTSEPATASA